MDITKIKKEGCKYCNFKDDDLEQWHYTSDYYDIVSFKNDKNPCILFKYHNQPIINQKRSIYEAIKFFGSMHYGNKWKIDVMERSENGHYLMHIYKLEEDKEHK